MKRFKTEQEIVDLIDKYNAELEMMSQAAADRDHLADCLKTTMESHRIPKLRDEAEKIRTQREWRKGRVHTLGERLSEFRTPQLPGVDNGDTSIPTT